MGPSDTVVGAGRRCQRDSVRRTGWLHTVTDPSLPRGDTDPYLPRRDFRALLGRATRLTAAGSLILPSA